jgi:hypothetical protein
MQAVKQTISHSLNGQDHNKKKAPQSKLQNCKQLSVEGIKEG